MIDRVKFMIDIACTPDNMVNFKNFILILSATLVGNWVGFITSNQETFAAIGMFIQWFAWMGAGIAGCITGIKYLKDTLKK
jgi:hypothetical protein